MRVKPRASGRPVRVIWTDAEKAKLIDRAVSEQREHPDLSGLPLLRAAMMALPVSRRRKVVAVTQAPFFEAGVVAEVKRRAADDASKRDLVPIAKATAETNAGIAANQCRFIEIHEEWMAMHREWRAEMKQGLGDTLALLAMLVQELRSLNAKLGQPVPTVDPYDTQPPANGINRHGWPGKG